MPIKWVKATLYIGIIKDWFWKVNPFYRYSLNLVGLKIGLLEKLLADNLSMKNTYLKQQRVWINGIWQKSVVVADKERIKKYTRWKNKSGCINATAFILEFNARSCWSHIDFSQDLNSMFIIKDWFWKVNPFYRCLGIF